MLSKKLMVSAFCASALALPHKVRSQGILNLLIPKTVCFIQHSNSPPTPYSGPDGRAIALTRQQCAEANALAQQMDFQDQQRMQQGRAPAQAQPAPQAAPKPQYQQKWKRVEADNGAVYAIDMNSISRSGSDNGSQTQADAVVCVVENDVCDIMQERRWAFYCAYNKVMMLTDAGFTPATYVPPRSIGRQLLDIACGRQ